MKEFLKSARFTPSDVLAAILDPAGSAKAWAALILAFFAQNGFTFDAGVQAAFTDLLVAAVVGVVTWVFPNLPKRDRVDTATHEYRNRSYVIVAIMALLASVLAVGVSQATSSEKADAISNCYYFWGGVQNWVISSCASPDGPGTQQRAILYCFNGVVQNTRYGPWVGPQQASKATCLAGYTAGAYSREIR